MSSCSEHWIPVVRARCGGVRDYSERSPEELKVYEHSHQYPVMVAVSGTANIQAAMSSA